MKIAIVGSGKVASWLLYVLHQQGLGAKGIYSRNKKTAASLAKKYQLSLFDSVERIDADLIILAVNDDNISSMGKAFKGHPATVVHTSGTVGLDALQQTTGRGIFYPLQTFAVSDYGHLEVPIFISSNDEATLRKLKALANKLSLKHFTISEEEKQHLHLAAVLTNNFINHLVVSAKDYLEAHELKYEMLLPLLKETFRKLTEKPYNFIQTGPAARGDIRTLKTHKKLLEQTELKKIYDTLTKDIINTYSHEDH